MISGDDFEKMIELHNKVVKYEQALKEIKDYCGMKLWYSLSNPKEIKKT